MKRLIFTLPGMEEDALGDFSNVATFQNYRQVVNGLYVHDFDSDKDHLEAYLKEVTKTLRDSETDYVFLPLHLTLLGYFLENSYDVELCIWDLKRKNLWKRIYTDLKVAFDNTSDANIELTYSELYSTIYSRYKNYIESRQLKIKAFVHFASMTDFMISSSDGVVYPKKKQEVFKETSKRFCWKERVLNKIVN